MNDARIAELLAPFLGVDPGNRQDEAPSEAAAPVSLSQTQLRNISIYIDILQRWNARINLTAVRDPEEIVTRHFGESLFIARQLFPRGERIRRQEASSLHVIDVGSGAGFPGLPIKVWDPSINLTLIESNQKKATFLREVVRSLGWDKVEVFAGRAEAFHGSKGDVVTLRAVERFETVLPVAAGLTGLKGRLAIMIGKPQLSLLPALLPNLKWSKPVILPLSNGRVLITGEYESG